MARRCQIDDAQRRLLLEPFNDGMNCVNKTIEGMRISVANEAGLTLQLAVSLLASN